MKYDDLGGKDIGAFYYEQTQMLKNQLHVKDEELQYSLKNMCKMSEGFTALKKSEGGLIKEKAHLVKSKNKLVRSTNQLTLKVHSKELLPPFSFCRL